jgi:hypothetical protein
MLDVTTSRQDTMTVDPELSPERANYIASKTSALRYELHVANPYVHFTTQGESTPVPDPDQLAKAFAFLIQGSFSSRVAVTAGGESQTWVWPNELDFKVRNVFLIFEFSTGSQGWACLDAGVTQLLIDRQKLHEELNSQWQKSLPTARHPKVTEAPAWLVRRMETLRRMPPPTSQEVETQLKASAEIRKKLTDKESVSSNGHEPRTPS